MARTATGSARARLSVRTAGISAHRSLSYRRWIPLSLGTAAVSLPILPDGLGYDPLSWLIWGREMDHGSLVTAGAASAFKPLPALLDALLAPFGSAAGDLWLACARAGVVISAVLVYHLAKALGGRTAAAIASAGWLTAEQVSGYLALEGMSEPLCAAFVLLAVDAHLARRPRLALVFAATAALVRIELWPFVACYAAVTQFSAPHHPKTGIIPGSAVLVTGVLAAVPAAWFLPDAISSGDLFRSVARATHESQGGPLLTPHPSLSTVAEGARMIVWPLVAIFVTDTAITVVAWLKLKKKRATFWLTWAAWSWLGLQAAMAALRIAAGAPRFLLPGVALAVVVAGCAWAALVQRLVALAPPATRSFVLAMAWLALLGASFGGLVKWAHGEHSSWLEGVNVQQLAAELPRAVARLGGRQMVVSCGTIAAAPLQNPAVAWALNIPLGDVGISPSRHGVVLAADGLPRVPTDGYRSVGTVGPLSARWSLFSACPPAPLPKSTAATGEEPSSAPQFLRPHQRLADQGPGAARQGGP
jgi:hypothetical protein